MEIMTEHLNNIQKDTPTMLHADRAPIREEQPVRVITEAPSIVANPAKLGRNTASKLGSSGRQVSLALQGGGSFGAFTWGFLDRLLEEEDLTIDVVSGASAGALNAVLLADGLAAGGNAGARERLDRFWQRVAHEAPHLPAGPGHAVGAAALFELSTRLASPYQLNPLGHNPMRRMLTEEIDFERLRAKSPIRLLIAATRVRDGRLHLFREDEITIEAVLASACLPFLHHAIEIDGEAYWDGGFSANPPLRQLVLDSNAHDVILVQLIPEEHGAVPHFSPEISRRMQEIAFVTSLHKELEALDDLRDVCSHSLTRSPICRKLQRLRFHRVSASDTVKDLDHESALDTRWSLIGRLKEHGRTAAVEWLAKNPPRKRSILRQ
jgi:NTE family protein